MLDEALAGLGLGMHADEDESSELSIAQVVQVNELARERGEGSFLPE